MGKERVMPWCRCKIILFHLHWKASECVRRWWVDSQIPDSAKWCHNCKIVREKKRKLAWPGFSARAVTKVDDMLKRPEWGLAEEKKKEIRFDSISNPKKKKKNRFIKCVLYDPDRPILAWNLIVTFETDANIRNLPVMRFELDLGWSPGRLSCALILYIIMIK